MTRRPEIERVLAEVVEEIERERREAEAAAERARLEAEAAAERARLQALAASERALGEEAFEQTYWQGAITHLDAARAAYEALAE